MTAQCLAKMLIDQLVETDQPGGPPQGVNPGPDQGDDGGGGSVNVSIELTRSDVANLMQLTSSGLRRSPDQETEEFIRSLAYRILKANITQNQGHG